MDIGTPAGIAERITVGAGMDIGTPAGIAERITVCAGMANGAANRAPAGGDACTGM